MRKIETLMNRAIVACKNWKLDNTEVLYNQEQDVNEVYLYNKLIARVGDTWIQLFDTGYQSNTVKSRLNALLLMNGSDDCGRVYQKDFQWFYSDSQQTIPFSNGMVLN